MAVLNEQARVEVWRDAMDEMSTNREVTSLLKTHIRAAVNGLDDLMQASETAINNAIPEPARSGLTTAQKARLLMLVVRRRYLAGGA